VWTICPATIDDSERREVEAANSWSRVRPLRQCTAVILYNSSSGAILQLKGWRNIWHFSIWPVLCRSCCVVDPKSRPIALMSSPHRLFGRTLYLCYLERSPVSFTLQCLWVKTWILLLSPWLNCLTCAISDFSTCSLVTINSFVRWTVHVTLNTLLYHHISKSLNLLHFCPMNDPPLTSM